jgi:acyl carrier protein
MGLDTVEFLMYAEKEFDITITDAEAGEIYTLGQFSRLCQQKLKPNNAMNEEQVFNKLKQILHQHFLSADVEISREDLIIKDLGLD